MKCEGNFWHLTPNLDSFYAFSNGYLRFAFHGSFNNCIPFKDSDWLSKNLTNRKIVEATMKSKKQYCITDRCQKFCAFCLEPPYGKNKEWMIPNRYLKGDSNAVYVQIVFPNLEKWKKFQNEPVANGQGKAELQQSSSCNRSSSDAHSEFLCLSSYRNGCVLSLR